MRTGTQSLERAIRLLVELSRRTTGWRLSDVARECELDLATAHRLLRALSASGFVVRRAADRHYLVGPELLNLGLAAAYHLDFVGAARSVARDVATATRQVCYICLRSGNDFTCIARSGRATLKGMTLRVGTRRALATSAGGAAMLVRLPAAERQRIVTENLARVRSVGALRVRNIERMLQRSQKCGFGLNRDDVVPGISAVGVAVELPPPWFMGSVLIVGPSEALHEAAIDAARGVLAPAAHLLEERAAALVGDGRAASTPTPRRRSVTDARTHVE
jgi:DNA-binding IclR family transcriptional regulator